MKELIDQSISDVRLLLNMIGCEDTEEIQKEILNNIADRLGKALDMMAEKPLNPFIKPMSASDLAEIAEIYPDIPEGEDHE